jgi:hypothetical protein
MIGLSGTKASAYKEADKVSTFVDTSVWFAAAAKGDRNNELAKSILQSVPDHVTTDHVLIETWLLLKSQFGRGPAEAFWERIRSSSVHIEPVTPVDLEAAWTIGSSLQVLLKRVGGSVLSDANALTNRAAIVGGICAEGIRCQR